MLSGENQTGRRPDNRELENIICWSQQNEINEQEHWKPLWLTQRFKRQIPLLCLKLRGRGGMQSLEVMKCQFSCTGGEWGSFLKVPLVLSWSRDLPGGAVPGSLVCSVSMDQTQQIDLTKGIMTCECLKQGVGCGSVPMPVGPVSALVLGSGCSDSPPSDRWGNYCHLSVD